MSYDYLKGFTQNGQTSHAGQTNAGQYEKAQGWQPAPQQPHESAAAYDNRLSQHRSNG